jgi:hypothetical protein
LFGYSLVGDYDGSGLACLEDFEGIRCFMYVDKSELFGYFGEQRGIVTGTAAGEGEKEDLWRNWKTGMNCEVANLLWKVLTMDNRFLVMNDSRQMQRNEENGD